VNWPLQALRSTELVRVVPLRGHEHTASMIDARGVSCHRHRHHHRRWRRYRRPKTWLPCDSLHTFVWPPLPSHSGRLSCVAVHFRLPAVSQSCRQSPLGGLSQVRPTGEEEPHEMNQKGGGPQLPACAQLWQPSRFGISLIDSSVRYRSSYAMSILCP
jgi:hypothetical protein